MNPKEFFDAVVELRDLQKLYFQTRQPDTLKRAKKKEAEIDAEIKRVKNVLAEQERKRLEIPMFPDSEFE